ncbi:MAG: MraY family glycosyltransferase [Planctomycetota bacterium]
MMMALFTVLFIGTFALSVLLTVTARLVALRTGFVAHPAQDRYHTRTVPLAGGAAIFWTITLTIIAAILAVKFLLEPGRLSWLGETVAVHTAGFIDRIPHLLAVLFFALVLHLLGLWDDRKRLGPFFKLAVQFAIAFGMAFIADIRVELFIHSKMITSLLSAFWIVLIINAFNFLDNMDGLSAGIALIASAVLLSVAAPSGQVFVSAMAVIFIAALAGFLTLNFPPAKIFMGDAGSLIVGLFVALLTLRTTYYQQAASGRIYAIFMPLVIMAVPLYDFVSVTVLRIVQGKSPFIGDTQHFSHRLKKRGLSDLQTVLTLYLATLCTGIGAVLLRYVAPVGAVLIFAQTLMILVVIAILEMSASYTKNEN